MSYYMVTEPITESLNAYGDELRAIRQELAAKYPATKCVGYEDEVAYGIDRFRREIYDFKRECKAKTKHIYEARRNYGLDVLARNATPMMAKYKADLVRECAIRMKAQGVQEAWVKNYTYTDGEQWIVTQSWYVYEDGGDYYFKMRKDCKAAHKIEGVA